MSQGCNSFDSKPDCRQQNQAWQLKAGKQQILRVNYLFI